MPRNVVDAFLKNEKDLAPYIGVNLTVLIRFGRVEVELYVARRQAIAL